MEAARARLGPALAALGVAALLAARFAPVLAACDTSFADYRALHGQQLVNELPDSRLNAWILAWVHRSAFRDPTTIFDANAFHPARNTLAGSEHLFGVALQTLPLRAFTSNAIAMHQLALFLSSVLLAATSFAALRCLSGSTWAGFLAAALSVFMPWRVTELSHLQLSSVQLFPLVWLLVVRGMFGHTGRRELLVLAVAVALQLLSSFYLAYFLTFSSAVLVAVCALMQRPALRDVVRLAAAVTPGYALLGLSALPYLAQQANAELASDYDPAFSMGLAGTWGVIAPRLPGVVDGMLNAAGNYHLPWGVALLVPCSLLALRKRQQAPDAANDARALRVSVAAWLAIAGFAFVMMLGGLVRIGSLEIPLPTLWLSELFPGFSLLRGPMRWGILIGVVAPLLAAAGALSLERLAPERTRLALRAVLVAALAPTLGLYAIPTRPAWEDPDTIAKRYAALAELDPGPLLEIPWSPGSNNADLGSRSLLASTLHWRPLLNGYTGHRPTSYRFLQRVGRRLPGPEAIDQLRDLTGVRWILLDATRMRQADLRDWNLARQGGWLRLAFSDAATRIFEVRGWERGGALAAALVDPTPRDRTLGGVPRASLSASHGRIELQTPRLQYAGAFSESIVTIHNETEIPWPGFDVQREGLVLLRYTYWSNPERGSTRLAPLDLDLPAGRTTRTLAILRSPLEPGLYRLCTDLVQIRNGRPVPLEVDAVERGVRVVGEKDESDLARLIASYYRGPEEPPPCGPPPSPPPP